MEIFDGCLRIDELADGYEFIFRGSEEWAFGLTELIVYERQRCPFFQFELVFEPGGGQIPPRARGPEGVKGVVAEMVGSTGG